MEPGANTYNTSLFIFRRDLRIEDNSGLIRALESSRRVLPLFVCDPRQLEPHPYRSENAVRFLASSLQDLLYDIARRGGALYFARGEAEAVVGDLAKNLKRTLALQAVFVNRDYTPFSRRRDAAIEAACRSAGIAFHSFGDALLHEPEAVTDAGKPPYKVFTPFMRFLRQIPVPLPRENKRKNYFDGTVEGLSKKMPDDLTRFSNPLIAVSGGRKSALKILARMGEFGNYRLERDVPALDATTHLSAHLKFGTVSTREVYHAIQRRLGPNHSLTNELYWRDFFHHVAFHNPRVFGDAFQEKYAGLRWNEDEAAFEAWKEGRTGFPIVDAGMRELNATGFMHNRVRMIVGSFLTKDLHIDWRWGERYFAQKLADYDPCVNNGNWQWVASTGCDAQPYFRIFNPWSQQLRFDPDCLYIKKWVPELKRLSAEEIHGLQDGETDSKVSGDSNRPASYPAPIVDHRVESASAIAMFKQPGVRLPGPPRTPKTRPTGSYGRRGGR